LIEKAFEKKFPPEHRSFLSSDYMKANPVITLDYKTGTTASIFYSLHLRYFLQRYFNKSLRQNKTSEFESPQVQSCSISLFRDRGIRIRVQVFFDHLAGIT